MNASPLVQRLAEEILKDIRIGSIGPGAHLSTQRLADRFGVSRSPVREALQLLLERGALEQLANRGFFARSGAELPAPAQGDRALPDGSADYQRLAGDWLTDQIPAEVTEGLLRERYGLTKGQLADILMRALREGWVERKQGYGWRFLPVAKTAEAFEQIYRFRMLIEPAALLEPTLRLDREVLHEQRRIQEWMLAGIETLPAEVLLDNGSKFHEALIAQSGNPFFLQALRQVNRMRRLLEYRAKLNRKRLYVQCTEHLHILALLDRGKITQASSKMRRHLSGALAQKSPVIIGHRQAELQPSAPKDAPHTKIARPGRAKRA